MTGPLFEFVGGAIASVFGLIAHEICHLGEKLGELFSDLKVENGFREGLIHDLEPAIALWSSNAEWEMACSEFGMASFLEVIWDGSEAKKKEIAESFFSAIPVILGIHGANEVVRFDVLVKGGGDLLDAVASESCVNELFVHGVFAKKRGQSGVVNTRVAHLMSSIQGLSAPYAPRRSSHE